MALFVSLRSNSKDYVTALVRRVKDHASSLIHSREVNHPHTVSSIQVSPPQIPNADSSTQITPTQTPQASPQAASVQTIPTLSLVPAQTQQQTAPTQPSGNSSSSSPDKPHHIGRMCRANPDLPICAGFANAHDNAGETNPTGSAISNNANGVGVGDPSSETLPAPVTAAHSTSTRTAIIAGSTIGVFILIALTVLAFLLYKRSCRRKVAPSAQFLTSQGLQRNDTGASTRTYTSNSSTSDLESVKGDLGEELPAFTEGTFRFPYYGREKDPNVL